MKIVTNDHTTLALNIYKIDTLACWFRRVEYCLFWVVRVDDDSDIYWSVWPMQQNEFLGRVLVKCNKFRPSFLYGKCRF